MSFRTVLSKSFLIAPLLVALLCFSSVARAAILLDNLGGALGNSAIITDETRAAVGFSVNSVQDGAWTFTIHAASSVPGGNTLVLQLVSDSAGEPGTTSPFTISGGFISAQTGYNVYTFTGSGQLNASTTYWLVASSTGSALHEYDWVYRGAYTETGANFVGFELDDGSGNWVSGGTGRPALQISIAPVPEPAQTGAIAALFLIACSLAHTFRGRAKAKLRKLFA